MQSIPLIVPKVWGAEIWLVNEPEYCFKLLEVKKGASGSLHYHKIKKETFILLSGKILLQVWNEGFMLGKEVHPMTILPRTPHRFTALEDSVLIEVSVHHDDDDVVRLEPSRNPNDN